MGANIPGKPRVFMPYIGGVGAYRRELRRDRGARLCGLPAGRRFAGGGGGGIDRTPGRVTARAAGSALAGLAGGVAGVPRGLLLGGQGQSTLALFLVLEDGGAGFPVGILERQEPGGLGGAGGFLDLALALFFGQTGEFGLAGRLPSAASRAASASRAALRSAMRASRASATAFWAAARSSTTGSFGFGRLRNFSIAAWRALAAALSRSLKLSDLWACMAAFY